MENRARLIELFRRRALKFGEFTLASGKKAGYYLDGKQITLHSEGLRLVSEGQPFGMQRDLFAVEVVAGLLARGESEFSELQRAPAEELDQTGAVFHFRSRWKWTRLTR